MFKKTKKNSAHSLSAFNTIECQGSILCSTKTRCQENGAHYIYKLSSYLISSHEKSVLLVMNVPWIGITENSVDWLTLYLTVTDGNNIKFISLKMSGCQLNAARQK